MAPELPAEKASRPVEKPPAVSAADRFLAELRQAWRRWEMPGSRVLVGVSGGPDSVALWLGLAELRIDVHAVHVHHGWRGAEADADAAWVTAVGQRLNLSTEIVAISPELRAEQAGKSLEEGARDARYQLLISAADRRGCAMIAVGHTAEDQVETVLHHILRGTGLSGLAGMPVERALTERLRLIRPMLTVNRSEVLAFLAAREQPYRVDVTNADVSLTRNRLRLELLPMLREEFNPQVDAALLRLAGQAAETAGMLTELAEKLLAEVLLDVSESCCRLDAVRLSRAPDPLIRQSLRQLWIRRNWPRQEMGQREWQRLAGLVHVPGTIDFPGGITARRETGPLVIGRR